MSLRGITNAEIVARRVLVRIYIERLADAGRPRPDRSARRLRKRRARTEGIERPCISCGRPMRSTGPHHRMCDPCHRDAQPWLAGAGLVE